MSGSVGRLFQHLGYPDRSLELEEANAFGLDGRGLVTRIEVFWQTPQDRPGGGRSAHSGE